MDKQIISVKRKYKKEPSTNSGAEKYNKQNEKFSREVHHQI